MSSHGHVTPRDLSIKNPVGGRQASLTGVQNVYFFECLITTHGLGLQPNQHQVRGNLHQHSCSVKDIFRALVFSSLNKRYVQAQPSKSFSRSIWQLPSP